MRVKNGFGLLAAAAAVLAAGCHKPAPAVYKPAAPIKPVVPAPIVQQPSIGGGSAVLAGYVPSANLFTEGPRQSKEVALTFDAGADDTAVMLLLKTLAERHVHCTFFLTGAFCKQFPAQCKAIADAGMELGNHSFHHPPFTKRTDKQIENEISSAEAEIVKVCGRGAKPLFRYPFGDSDKRVRALVASQGYQAISWSLDSLDSVGKPKSADFVAARVLSKIKPGGITLMHVSRVESAKSLPRIFEYLDSQGIKVVPVSELLKCEKEELAARQKAKQDAHAKTAVLKSVK